MIDEASTKFYNSRIMISCILLSAGSSRRFGSPKALAQFEGECLIERLQKTLIRSLVHETVIVLGDHSEDIKTHLLNHKKVKSVYSKEYKNGQTASFKTGLKALSDSTEGILLLPVDVPFVKSSTIDFLITEFIKKQPLILIPTFKGK